MKQYLYMLFLLVPVLGGCNKPQEQDMTVVRDCSGTYLRLNNKDYQVCNTATTNNFAVGTRVKVVFRSAGECKEATGAVCELYHPSEGWIKIVHIKKA